MILNIDEIRAKKNFKHIKFWAYFRSKKKYHVCVILSHLRDTITQTWFGHNCYVGLSFFKPSKNDDLWLVIFSYLLYTVPKEASFSGWKFSNNCFCTGMSSCHMKSAISPLILTFVTCGPQHLYTSWWLLAKVLLNLQIIKLKLNLKIRGSKVFGAALFNC